MVVPVVVESVVVVPVVVESVVVVPLVVVVVVSQALPPFDQAIRGAGTTESLKCGSAPSTPSNRVVPS